MRVNTVSNYSFLLSNHKLKLIKIIKLIYYKSNVVHCNTQQKYSTTNMYIVQRNKLLNLSILRDVLAA